MGSTVPQSSTVGCWGSRGPAALRNPRYAHSRGLRSVLRPAGSSGSPGRGLSLVYRPRGRFKPSLGPTVDLPSTVRCRFVTGCWNSFQRPGYSARDSLPPRLGTLSKSGTAATASERQDFPLGQITPRGLSREPRPENFARGSPASVSQTSFIEDFASPQEPPQLSTKSEPDHETSIFGSSSSRRFF